MKMAIGLLVVASLAFALTTDVAMACEEGMEGCCAEGAENCDMAGMVHGLAKYGFLAGLPLVAGLGLFVRRRRRRDE